MAQYANVLDRADVGGALIPDAVANEIIQELPHKSVALSRMRRIPLSTKKTKQTVLSALPAAFWVSGDTGLKQTTEAAWKDVEIVAEELAVLLPIPDAVIDDSRIPLWDQVKPLMEEAAGLLIDKATIWGVDKPASWPTAMVPGAIAAGNTLEAGTGVDLAQDITKLAGLVAADGFAVNGFASKPGMQWELVGLRSAQGTPIFQPALTETAASRLYGYTLDETVNGSWQPTVADLIAADWNKFVIGVRQDITWKLLDQAVITDDAGKVIFNAAQQDSQIMRMVMRVGFQVANPLTRVNPTEGTRYPAGVLTPDVTP